MLLPRVLLSDLRVPFCSSDVLPGQHSQQPRLQQTGCAGAPLCSLLPLHNITSYLYKYLAHVCLQKLNFNVLVKVVTPAADI